MRLALAALVWALPGLAWAQGAFLAVEVAGSGVARAGHADARRGQAVHVHLVVPLGDGRFLTSAPRLEVGRRTIAARDLVRPEPETGATVRWSRIEPRMFHPPPDDADADPKPYSNSVLFGPHHGRWRGVDPIEYFESPIRGSAGFALTLRSARPSDRRFDVHGGLGVMRVRAVAVVGTQTLATPGLEAVRPAGIGDEVPRVTFRGAEGFLGWLTSFHNVPNVFGSAGRGARHQTAQYAGTDCADVMLGALRRATRTPIEFTSVAGLARLTEPVLDARIENDRLTDPGGRPIRVRFGETVRPGDLVMIDYGSPSIPRPWAHVGAVFEDRAPGGDSGPDGLFGPEDLLAHTAFLHGLALQPLATQAPARIRVVRWNARLRRELQRGSEFQGFSGDGRARRGRRVPRSSRQ